MKEMSIYVDGKYDYRFQTIRYIYYLSYKTAVVKKSGTIVQQGSPARAQLQSLYLALQRVTEPCIINIYSKYPLGFKNPKKCNSKDLIVEILNAINKAGHIVKFIIDKEFYQVDIWEQTYGTRVPKPDNISNKQIENKPDIGDKQSPNDIFSIKEDSILSKEEQLQKEYEELNNDMNVWVPGSGGY